MKRNKNRHKPLDYRGHVGDAPGTISSKPGSRPSVITVMAYGPEKLIEQRVNTVAEIEPLLGEYPVVWVNVDGLGNADVIQQIGSLFELHPLALEDTVNTHQRAKVDDYGDVLFVAMRMIQKSPLATEQVAFFVGRDFVITFQEELAGDSFEAVRTRIRQKRGRIRTAGSDYLLYELLDSTIDGYFPVLERYGVELDELDDHEQAQRLGEILARLHDLRRDLLFLRRVIWPLRDASQALLRGGHSVLSHETQVYLRDCYDHSMQLIDILEIYRETCTDLRDFYYSKLTNRTNEIMRMLTIIATVFMPLSFIAGLYGMNFERMPELKWPFGYPMALSLMGTVASGFLFFFWRKGWLRSAEARSWQTPHVKETGLSE